MRNGRIREMSHKALAVILTVSMVMSQTPSGYAYAASKPATSTTTQSAATTASTTTQSTTSSKSQSTSSSAAATSSAATTSQATTVDVALDLQNAYISVSGQTVAAPTTKVTVPAGKKLTFSAAADSGYEVSSVSMTADGETTKLSANADGTYSIPAASVAAGVGIVVVANAKSATASTTGAAVLLSAQSDGTAYTTGAETYKDILGNGAYFGIVANIWDQVEAETNAAVKVLNASQQTGNDKTNPSDQPWVLGQVNGSFYLKGVNADVWCRAEDEAKIHASGNVVTYHDSDEATLDAYVDDILSNATSYSNEMAAKQSFSGVITSYPNPYDTNSGTNATGELSLQGGKYTIDITSKGAGTYYVNVDSFYANAQADSLTIKKNTDQTIVLNLTGTSVTLQKFSVVNGGTQVSSDQNTNTEADSDVASTVIWNMPNATEVNTGSSTTGVFLAPKATFNVTSTSGGWIVANHVKNSSGEWHNVWQHMDKDYKKPTTTGFKVSKTVDGATPTSAQAFTFDLSEKQADGSWKKIGTAQNAGGTAAFDAISYTTDDAGTHDYRISEESSAGYEDNATAYYVRVVVTNTTVANTTTATAKTTYYSDEACTKEINASGLSFDNTSIKSTSVSLGAKKVLNGGSLTAGEFSFQLKDANGNVLQTKTNAADGSVSFDAIKYEAAGTYTYTISEVNNGKGGVGYDTTSHAVKVVVSDDGKGNLSAVTTYDDKADVPTFTNTYTLKGTSVTLAGTKTLSGAKMTDGEFSFTVKENGVTVATGKSTVGGSINFGTISYTAAGEHDYVVTEDVPADASKSGITYDATAKTVHVSVKDNGAGQLVATTTYGSGSAVSFANAYSAKGSVVLKATKSLSGSTLKEGQFSFQLKDEDGKVLQTKSNSADGSVTFDAIDYAAAGTYAYTISEVAGTAAGYTYDATVRKVTVTVADDGRGNLTATPAYEGGAATFSNSYAASGTASLSASKTLSGATLKEGEFSFVLKSGDTVLQTKTNDASGNVAFDDLTYTQGDAGTYAYTISEVIPDGSTPNGDGTFTKAGITYDGHVRTATVTVSDNGNGTLSTSVKYDGGKAPTFSNAYKASGSVALGATKTLNGAAPADGAFSFELKDANGNVLQTKENGTNGSVLFDAISYTQDDAGKTYTYTISEKLPEGVTASNPTKDGITYDTSVHTVTVAVSDDGKGTITATPSYVGGAATFANTYSAKGTLSLAGTKTMEGRALKDGDAFAFTVKEGTRTVATGTSDASGKISYTSIEYGLKDVGDHTYTVTENTYDAKGVKSSTQSHTVKVNVSDNGDGTLKVTTLEGSDDPSKLDFTNTYTATGATATLQATKSLSGRGWLDNETYSFTLAANDGAPMPASDTANATKDARTASFGSISYDKAGIYTYTISESVPEGATKNDEGVWTKDGVFYDGATYTATVTVNDNGDGTMSSSVSYQGGEVPTFHNSYQAANATAKLEGTKAMSGRPFRQGDSFAFSISAEQSNDATGYAMPKNTTATVSPNSGATADFSFDEISFSKVGTYKFDIVEVAGSEGGVTYSTAKSTATVVVTDNNDGTMSATVTYDGSAARPTFTNSYDASGSVSLEAAKSLVDSASSGKTLSAGEFSFVVKDAAGNQVATGTNDADGKVSFSPISYKLADAGRTFAYTISEVAGAADGYAYDASAHTVTVAVADNGDGTLKATPSYDGGAAPTFTNTYAAKGSVVLKATKSLSGSTLKEGQFSFQLKDEDGKVLQTKSNSADGSVTFDTIDYTAAGTYAYTISEVAGTAAGYTYDATVRKVTVTVADDGRGNLTATPAYEGGAATFSNSYAAKGSVSLTANKQLTGTALAADEFSFQVLDASNNVVATGTNAADGTIAFTQIPYTQDDAGKTFEYSIVEKNDGRKGVDYDAHVAKVSVSVFDNGDGTLAATPTYEGVSAVVFTNTYNASGTAQLQVSKTLDGRDWTDGNESSIAADDFSFTVSALTAGAKLPGDTIVHATRTNQAPSFGDITYTQADLAGSTQTIDGKRARTFDYQITENVPANATDNGNGTKTYNGVTYSAQPVVAHVTVIDNGDGTLSTQVHYGDDTTGTVTSAAFTNTYEAAGTSASLTATKTLSGSTLEKDQFSFKLKDADGNVLQTKTNAADGSVSFDAIKYEATGTYTYTISEDLPKGVDAAHPTKDDITYDTTSHTATVTVTDDGNGKLVAAVAYDATAKTPGTTDAPTFANTHFSDTWGTSFTKNYYGSGNPTFDYKLETADASGNARTASETTYDATAQKIVDDGTNGFSVALQNGAFTNHAATVTIPNVTYYKAGTYCYLLTETSASGSTVTCDSAQYLYTVAVPTDQSAPTVTCQMRYGTDGTWSDVSAVSFYNNSAVKLSMRCLSIQSVSSIAQEVSVSPTAKKTFTGGSLTAGEFNFELRDADGAVVSTGTNGADGSIAFNDITYTQVGINDYTMDEVAGTDGTIAYDTTSFAMRVIVTQNPDGSLSAMTTYGTASDPTNPTSATAPTFANKVKGVNLRVQKTSKSGGEALAGAVYGLWMVNNGGNDVYMGNGTSDAQGYITFDDVNVDTSASYYFKEESAPAGHLVDPYRSDTFSIEKTANGYELVLCQRPDHPAGRHALCPVGHRVRCRRSRRSPREPRPALRRSRSRPTA
jgi:pilin isopeptide linkage protein